MFGWTGVAPTGGEKEPHVAETDEGKWKGLELTGGRVFLSRPQLIFANHLCCLTSLAPLLLPSLVRSFLSSSRVMQSLHAL